MEEPSGWLEEGTARSEQGDFTGAVAAFDKAITCNQSPKEAWYRRGLVCARMGNYRQALHSFDQVLFHDPGDADAKKAKEMVAGLQEKQKVATRTFPALNPDHPFLAPAPASPRKPAFPADGVSYRSPFLALVFSFLFTGWGQWYNGRRWAGLVFFGLSLISGILNFGMNLVLGDNLIVTLIFSLIGMVIWAYSMYDAFDTATNINAGNLSFTRKSRLFWLPLILYIIIIVVFIIIVILIVTGFGFGTSPYR